MASFSQNKYCYNCKRNVTTTKQDATHCPKCGGVVTLGDWTIRFRTIENGKRKNKRLSGFATKKEAQAALAEYMTTARDSKGNEIVYVYQDLLAEYLALDKTQTAPATYYDKQAIFAKYITPYFINKDLNKLTKLI